MGVWILWIRRTHFLLQFSSSLMALRLSDSGIWRLSQAPAILVSPDNAEWTQSSLWLIFHIMSWLHQSDGERDIPD